jgi:hypothetical protein
LERKLKLLLVKKIRSIGVRVRLVVNTNYVGLKKTIVGIGGVLKRARIVAKSLDTAIILFGEGQQKDVFAACIRRFNDCLVVMW